MVRTKKPQVFYQCQSCGHVSPRWVGKCSECESWNTFVEQIGSPRKTASRPNARASKAERLSDVSQDQYPRVAVENYEFNRVLGGGIVAGSVILIAGDPGIGKSTLMLQEAVSVARGDYPVLYVSGEESERQTKLRAHRLGVDSEHVYILSTTDINDIIAAIESLSPSLVVVDSIQTVHQPLLESSPGSISQVRDCAFQFIKVAKYRNMPIFLIGHVTKEGAIAGPKVLEHMVDVLLHFEGDRDHVYRILRAVKNRFGSTREIGVFEMKQSGLMAVENPSALFLEQRKEGVSGSSVICTLEGTRPFLVEIQALVTSSSYGLPQRNTTGIDSKRLSLLLAVLEKRLGLVLGASDIFVNAAGGARIEEPSADLGVLAAIASSFKDSIVDPSMIILGEVGLGGEIRAVPQVDKRLDEAGKLGFKKAVVPKFNARNLESNSPLQLYFAEKADEALEVALN